MTKEEVKARVEQAMRNANIFSRDDAESAIDFVRDLLEIDVDETEDNEPYATSYIAEVKVAIQRVIYLTDVLDKGE